MVLLRLVSRQKRCHTCFERKCGMNGAVRKCQGLKFWKVRDRQCTFRVSAGLMAHTKGCWLHCNTHAAHPQSGVNTCDRLVMANFYFLAGITCLPPTSHPQSVISWLLNLSALTFELGAGDSSGAEPSRHKARHPAVGRKWEREGQVAACT